MFCHHCGAPVEAAARFCPACGGDLQAAGPGAPPPGGPGPVPEFRPQQEFVPPAHVQVRTGDWISQGWALVQSDLVSFILMALLILVISSVVPILLQGPLLAGLHFVCIKKLLGRRADIGDLFKGFNYFIPALLATLVMTVFIAVGVLLCIIPGLVVAAMYQFTYLFIVDKKMEFWPAMKASHAIVRQDYVGFTLLLIVFGLLHILGVLACLVGLLITIPIQCAALTVAYREIVGLNPNAVD